MKILITGSTGFVGRHLLPLLNEANHNVIHLVREPKGFVQEYVWDFESDILDQIPASEVVIHLAAYADFTTTLKKKIYKVNTISTIKLANYCQKHKALFILASMTGIHGGATYLGKDSPIAPINHYGMSKYIAEEIVQTFVDDVFILRIGGIYGLDGPKHLGLNTAISNALHTQTLPTLKGPGKAKRNYICVQDIVRWIAHLVKPENRATSQGGNILYMAGTEVLSIEEYLQTIVDVLLPGKQLEYLDGSESQDSIIEVSKAPFSLTSFWDYLSLLKSTY